MSQVSPKIDDKLNYSITVITLVLIVLLGLVFWWTEETGWFQIRQPLPSPSSPVSDQPHTPSDRAEVFDISGAKMTPDFVKELIIDPFYEAEIGERQYFSVWVEDPKGVALVKVIIKDLETEVGIINLVLKEGDNNRGRWEGTWNINNVTSGTAPVLIFQAQNQEGETAEIETYFYVKEQKQSWLKDFFSIKPVFAGLCFPSGNTSGHKPISNCSIQGGSTVGTDGGNLIIQGDITMESNSIILFEPGYHIEIVSGKILKSQTNTKILKGDVVVTITCSNNEPDCDDGDYCTQNICNNPGTASSYCSNPAADRCGDGTCNCEETASTCSADCGNGGGGGNGGGCIPVCQWSDTCDESAPDGCGGTCTRNTDGIQCAWNTWTSCEYHPTKCHGCDWCNTAHNQFIDCCYGGCDCEAAHGITYGSCCN